MHFAWDRIGGCYAESEMFPPAAIEKKPRINAAVAEVIDEFSPSVKYIRYDIGQDWSGQVGCRERRVERSRFDPSLNEKLFVGYTELE